MRTTFGDMEHLATEAVVAFVDGELGMTAYQRAAAHLSVCAECAADVDAQQCARTAVRSAVPFAMSDSLRGQLYRIPETSALGLELLANPLLPTDVATSAHGADTVPAARTRTRRSFPLGVLAVSAIAAGVLAAMAAVPDPATSEQPAHAAAVPPQRGAEVVAVTDPPHARLVSFGAMFAAPGAHSTGSPEPTQLELARVGLVQTPASP